MRAYALSGLTNEQQEQVLNNIVQAVQVLHKSVKERVSKQYMEKIKNEPEGETDRTHKRLYKQ